MSTTTPDKPVAPVTVEALRARKGGEKIVYVTAYDTSFARLADAAGVDAILVGDSLGMVIQGGSNTLAVTLDEMIYHARAVVRGVQRAHVVCDLPFGSYQISVEDGLRAATRVIKESGAHAVKLEGGVEVAPLCARLVGAGIPVMGHIGLTPQSFHAQGGFKVQGRNERQRTQILDGAKALDAAGVYGIVLEGMPVTLAREITALVSVPTIGIGAGPDCDGQVLVLHDLLGLDPNWSPRFARRYAELGREILRAFTAYTADVKSGAFPGEKESFK